VLFLFQVRVQLYTLLWKEVFVYTYIMYNATQVGPFCTYVYCLGHLKSEQIGLVYLELEPKGCPILSFLFNVKGIGAKIVEMKKALNSLKCYFYLCFGGLTACLVFLVSCYCTTTDIYRIYFKSSVTLYIRKKKTRRMENGKWQKRGSKM